jgi:vacuolar-type H+-ATPase subunit I/STV1
MADPDRLHAAVREARDDASPFALGAAGILIVLALVSMHAHWDLLGRPLWWMWLIVAAPYLLLSATLQFGLKRLVRHDRRREIAVGLLGLVWLLIVVGVAVLVISLVSHQAVHITGRQLLLSGGVVWLANAIAFGLAYWELDSGGPVTRALAPARRQPDFQFPQDENPELAREGWAPRLMDYFYVSLTNATAFSPTDAMPLTRLAKTLMAAESGLSAITILLVAARAVNILQ